MLIYLSVMLIKSISAIGPWPGDETTCGMNLMNLSFRMKTLNLRIQTEGVDFSVKSFKSRFTELTFVVSLRVGSHHTWRFRAHNFSSCTGCHLPDLRRCPNLLKVACPWSTCGELWVTQTGVTTSERELEKKSSDM